MNHLRRDNLTFTDPKDMANELCNHYSQIGAKMSKAIPKSTIDQITYLKKTPQNDKSLFLAPTSEKEIASIIDKLPNKKVAAMTT